jgi:uncharacterized protein (TIGR03790 family)
MMRLFLLIALVLPNHALAQFTAEWEPAAETVVVYNPKFPGSEALAREYGSKRLIPSDRVIGLDCPVTDSMSRAEFNQQLREPLRKIFTAKKWWTLDAESKSPAASSVARSGIRVLVLMRGIPFQVRRDRDAPPPQKEDEASVDSELTLLAMNAPPTEGALKNPYYGADVRLPRFTKAPGLLLVGRLDGPSDDIVRRMIDDSLFAEENGLQGRAVIDLALKSGGFKEGEDWLLSSAATFQRHGIPLYIDRHELVMRDHWPLPDTILYFGWYTMDAAGAVASPEFQFKRGAVACHIHSFSASVMRDPKQHWTGPLLVKGAAATFGNVFEPYLSLTVHFDLLNKRLLEGFTLAEAAWSATPALSWMSVVVGDPLYRPFAKNGGSSLGSADTRDYLLYQGAARRSPLDPDSAIKTTITTLAERRKSSRLLEFTALLSGLQGKHAEAIDLFDHAEALSPAPADRVRLRLYRAEMFRRDGKPQTAADLLRDLLSDESVKAEPARAAAESLLREVGG